VERWRERRGESRIRKLRQGGAVAGDRHRIVGDLDIPAIWRKCRDVAHFVAGGPWQRPPCKSALSQAARDWGRDRAAVVRRDGPTRGNVEDPRRVLPGMRLLLIDGQKLSVPDTPANARAFGKLSTTRYGQEVLAAIRSHHRASVEAGTHLSVEALLKPAKAAEYPWPRRCWPRFNPAIGAVGPRILWLQPAAGRLDKAHNARTRQFPGDIRTRPNAATARIWRTFIRGTAINIAGQSLRCGCWNTRWTIRIVPVTGNASAGHHALDADQFPALELIVLYHQRWRSKLPTTRSSPPLARPWICAAAPRAACAGVLRTLLATTPCGL